MPSKYFRGLSALCLLLCHLPGSVSAAPPTNAVALAQDDESSDPPLSPLESTQGMQLPDDLALDLLVAEPAIQQPVFLNFDARGRMWIVEYRQYPEPAGLELVSRDRFWRNVYDRKPLPPGHPDFVPGLDRISIHEDTNGDGTYDHSKTFVDGLSLATSCVIGHGGVWVLNPPYLLFYPDADGDDVPDGAPEVHLDGFGIQDTHAIVNSLCWGPDGWLYAAQGSTVTSDIVVAGSDAPPVSRSGQLMWRYHPTQKIYEVFAEGGGNVWSCEFDSQGRLFAGTNDKFPAYFFLQGGFYRKNFGKHGALSNPYAFDFFEGIASPGHRRISNSVLIYEGGTLPARYDGSLLFLGALQGTVGAYQLTANDLNYRGTALDLLVNAQDRWFRPVYMESGPDGAVYVCDWYDQQINHYRNHEGKISKQDGRLFRIRRKDTAPLAPFDLNQRSTSDLIDLLDHPNRWWRETAQTLLGWREDRHQFIPRLRHTLENENGQSALEALWALNRCDAFDQSTFEIAAAHPHPSVRQWAIRLAGDRRENSPPSLQTLINLARSETNLEVLGQIASSAGRIPVDQALPVIASLLRNDTGAGVRHFESLIWWSLEPFYAQRPDQVAALFDHDVAQTDQPASPTLVSYIMRRMAAEGRMADLRRCARLIRHAATPALLAAAIDGFEAAYIGKPMSGLPSTLVAALVENNRAPISLRLRLDLASSLEEALEILRSPTAAPAPIQRVLEVFAEQPTPAALPLILERISDDRVEIQQAALAALQGYDELEIARVVLSRLPQLQGQAQEAAQSLLTSRVAWSEIWLKSITPPVSANALAAIRRHQDPTLDELIHLHFGPATTQPASASEQEIARVRAVVSVPGGDPKSGFSLYQQRCAACHTLFSAGGNLGPDLTSYQRDQTDTLLLSIINPSAEIRSGYEMVTVKTIDGRTLSGFLARNEIEMLSLRIIGGNEVILRRDELLSIELQPGSLMPAGLLNGLSDSQLQDLWSYLRSPQPLSLN